jgi:ATP-dependent exoDNAse (exonuclease V) beta subunit
VSTYVSPPVSPAAVRPRALHPLEFDHVVVVEPADLVAATDTGQRRSEVGLRQLYVALTRAVSRLSVVHARPLPVELAQR